MNSHLRSILVYFFKIDKMVKEEKSFEVFVSIFNSGGHLVQRSGMV